MDLTVAKVLLLGVVAGVTAHSALRVRGRARSAPELGERLKGLAALGGMMSLVLAMNALPALTSLDIEAQTGGGGYGAPGGFPLLRWQATVLFETAILVQLAWGPIVAAAPSTDDGARAVVASMLGRLSVRFALAAVGFASLFGISSVGPLDVLRTPIALASPAGLLAVETAFCWAVVRFGPRRMRVPVGAGTARVPGE